MAHAGEEKDLKELDPVGIATNSEIHPDLVAEHLHDSSEEYLRDFVHEKSARHEEKEKDLAHTTELTRHSTDATDVTSSSEPAQSGKDTRSRWMRWNPLKRNPPPIPKIRGQSREYNASFWSMLTFQWVTPIMSVSLPIHLTQCLPVLICVDRICPTLGV